MESRERNYKKALLQKLFGIIRTRAHLHKTYPLAYLHTRTCVSVQLLYSVNQGWIQLLPSFKYVPTTKHRRVTNDLVEY